MGYYITTLEFMSEDSIPDKENMDEELQFLIEDSFKHEKYISKNTGNLTEKIDIDYQIKQELKSKYELGNSGHLEDVEIIAYLFDNLEINRVGICNYTSSSGFVSHTIYGTTEYGLITSLDDTNDSDVTDDPNIDYRTGKSTEVIRDRHNFDAWDHRDMREAKRSQNQI